MKSTMHYVLPRNAADGDPAPDDFGMADLNGILDGLVPGGGDPPPEPEPDPNPEPEPEPEPGQPQPPAEPTPTPADLKAHQAFASLRAENTAIKNAMRAFAKANEIQFTDDADLMQKVQEIDLKKRAAAQGIPEDVLRRLETLESVNQMYSAEQLRTQALVGFQRVKDDFKLTPEELQTFGDTLYNEGVDPFKEPVDIRKEYVSRNLDKIIEQRTNAAVEAALKRQGAANDNGSTPPSKKGGGSHTGKDVSTVGDLNALLDQLK